MNSSRKVWRGWRFKKLSPEKKLLILAGVPERFHEKGGPPDFRTISFEGISGNITRIESKVQSKWNRDLLNPSELIKGWMIIIGSIKEDTQSLHVAFNWIRDLIVDDSLPDAKIIDLGDVPDRNEKDLNGSRIGYKWWSEAASSQVLMMHNIIGDECSSDRVQITRDIIRRFPNTTRILVVSGANPVKFAQDVLYIRPDVCFYTDGQVQKRVSH